MKLMLAAIALTIASPALAQTAAPADAHADHAAHATQAAPVDHSAHGAGSNGNPHADHEMAGGCCEKMGDGKMPCCEKMKAAGKKMDCCAKKADAPGAADPHAGHDMKQAGDHAGHGTNNQ